MNRFGLFNQSFNGESGEFKNKKIMNMLTGINSNMPPPLPSKNDEINKNSVKLNDLYNRKEKVFLNQRDEANANLNLMKDKSQNRMKEIELGKTPLKSIEELKGANRFWIFDMYK